jgi:Reprolysin family propeptide./Reprolysin (M12B) family zinc metalloprotease./Calx-beta domain./Bacterial pre-peptidase C-terminal domain.
VNKLLKPANCCFLLAALICSAALFVAGRVHTGTTLVRAASVSRSPLQGVLVKSRLQDPELARRLRKYDLIRMDPHAAAAQIRSKRQILLKTSAGDYELSLEPYDLRSPNYAAQVIGADGVARKLPKTPIQTYRGKVRGLANAQVRFTVKESSIEGAIITQSGHYFLQPARDLSTAARSDEFVFYAAADLNNDVTSCGVTLAEEVAARENLSSIKTKADDTAAATTIVNGLSPLKIVRLATDADGEYVAALGGASQANTQIMNIMNMVDGIYQLEIGLSFQIVFQNAWTDSSTDPYTSTVPGTLLGEFKNHWNANFSEVSRSLAHLWTGKDLDGSIIGIASLGATCRTATSSYGLSQLFPFNRPGNPITVGTAILTAHEIGHNFSASHTNEASPETPPDIERACDNTIMEASIGDGSSFCSYSRSQIVGHAVAYASCLLDSASLPPVSNCAETPLSERLFITNASLTNSDCRSPSRGSTFFADRYTFNATAGQRFIMSVTQNPTGPGLDPYIYLIGPDGYVMAQDDDSGGGQSAQIPSSGPITVPSTGTYIIEVTSFLPQQTGNYNITLFPDGCSLSVTPPIQHFPAVGGNGQIQVSATGSCNSFYLITTEPSPTTWLTATGSGNTSQSFSFTVQPNTGTAGRRAFVLVGAGANNFGGGLRIPITQSGTRPDCNAIPIAFGQTATGTLESSDCESPVRGNGFFADRYTFDAFAGQKIFISLSSPNAPDTDTFLTLIGPNGVVLLNDDDSGGLTNSRIPGGNGLLPLGLPAQYTIEVTTFGAGSTGPYALTLGVEPPKVQFSQAIFGFGESEASLNVTVTRSGDLTGVSTVEYATSDTAGANNCNIVNGQASSRCDYITTFGKLQFAPGETTKSIGIPIIDDVYPEGTEDFSITLSNPSGATLGSQATALLSIGDLETQTTNPIENAAFFARQHYLDFLNREPDLPGLAFWTGQIAGCTTDMQCREIRRINVSAAFFLSIEFQETGYLVYRMHKSSFGNLPGSPVPIGFTDFLRDTQEIGRGVQVGVGNWQAQLESNKQSFALAFVQRDRFQTAFPNTLSATQFVDQLNQNAGDVLSTAERSTLIAMLTVPSDATQRAAVVRAVAEDQDLKNAEFNKAFVLMQYFGYLRRNPNDLPDTNFNGFDFWLTKLNQFNGNFIQAEMVKAFITSSEYTQRFGP